MLHLCVTEYCYTKFNLAECEEQGAEVVALGRVAQPLLALLLSLCARLPPPDAACLIENRHLLNASRSRFYAAVAAAVAAAAAVDGRARPWLNCCL